MESGRSALIRFVEKVAMRSPLNEPERTAIIELPFQIIEVSANRDFVRLGEVVTHACLIGSGLAGRFGQTRDGARQIAAFHLPGDMADLHSVVVPEASSALQALTKSTIVKVPHDAIRQIAKTYPTIAEAFWRECVIDASILAESVLNMGRRNAVSRLAHLLCEITCRYNLSAQPSEPNVPFAATQMHLGDALGLTPVHVNRSLRQLREQGLVTVRQKHIDIHDWPGLVAQADFDPAYLQLDRLASKAE